MLKYGLILLAALVLWACGASEPDYQSIAPSFKKYHSEKNLDALLELFNCENMYAPYRKVLRRVLAEEIDYPIKSITLRPITYTIASQDIYNIQPTHELIVEYAIDYQLSSVYLFGSLNGKPALAWITAPEIENNIAPLVGNTQSLENLNSL